MELDDDLNYIWSFRCNNCGFTRPYKRKQRGTTETPSQSRAAERIRKYYTGEWYTRNPEAITTIHKFEKKMQGGTMFVSVDTNDSILSEHGHFAIGRKGKIEVIGVGFVGWDRKQRIEHGRHVAKMLGGKSKVHKY
jgi:hypothetical protein